MPSLDWIGKDKIINHHKTIPYCTLERQYSYDKDGQHTEDNGSQNMIIHGDNLYALKALLPQYEGKIKCIYIDPPYNTGNKDWCYNDNVDHPLFKKWLEETLNAKESERFVHADDLSKHDKWLCMMYPRLVILQKLLSDDGAIFISIDDNEEAYLKLICDEIFGSNNFISNISWQRTYSTRNDSKSIVTTVEHILAYSKNPNWSPKKLPRTEEMDAIYKSPDGDPKLWTSSSVTAPEAASHQGMVYAIQHPFNGEMMYPTKGRHWSLGQTEMLENLRFWGSYELMDINDAEKRAHICDIPIEKVREGVQAIVLTEPIELSKKKANEVLKGVWPIFYFTNGGKGGLRRKTYLENMGGRLPTNFWPFEETGHTDEAKKEQNAIFSGKSLFDTPKPTRLIDRILTIASDTDSIILDSFAGSATTAHSVLKQNQIDGGNRKFILIEMMDYCNSVTAERVKRVITGYKDNEGLNGSFSYYELGPSFKINELLNPKINIEEIKKFVYYIETKRPYIKPISSNPTLIGKHGDTAYYLIYSKEFPSILEESFLKMLDNTCSSHVIYAEACYLSEKMLDDYNIRFKKIPRDIRGC